MENQTRMLSVKKIRKINFLFSLISFVLMLVASIICFWNSHRFLGVICALLGVVSVINALKMDDMYIS
ncbi:hypothetical protein BG261_04265 [Floricoccus tropicus]|uniref:Uncharacterized protein n=1 Tax=Floricoccus tropicus TaxID=1859473 RepID=A0A1E8GLG6_9LACT|nr:hypothetical protein BG261_04265 [Floricoccus tropicus]